MLNNVLIKQIIKPLYNHYTAGESLINLQQKIIELNKRKIYPIVDYIKESSTISEIYNSINEYKNIANINNVDTIALKLSTFNFNYYHINNIVNHLVEKNKIVLIDAEEIKNQNKINDITNNLIETFNYNSINVYKTYQMYRKDSLNILKHDLDYFPFLGVKLVRGAYHNTDLHSGLLFTNKEDTDKSFDKSMKLMFDKIKTNSIDKNKMFICTHNKKDIDTMISIFLKTTSFQKSVYHASLYGFINNDTNKIIESGIKTYKYLPYGKMEDSVPYLMRRLYEKYNI